MCSLLKHYKIRSLSATRMVSDAINLYKTCRGQYDSAEILQQINGELENIACFESPF
jgi:hypothetical protein